MVSSLECRVIVSHPAVFDDVSRGQQLISRGMPERWVNINRPECTRIDDRMTKLINCARAFGWYANRAEHASRRRHIPCSHKNDVCIGCVLYTYSSLRRRHCSCSGVAGRSVEANPIHTAIIVHQTNRMQIVCTRERTRHQITANRRALVQDKNHHHRGHHWPRVETTSSQVQVYRVICLHTRRSKKTVPWIAHVQRWKEMF